MKKIGMVVLLSLLMTGCAIKKEGIMFSSSGKYQSIEFEKCSSKGCPDKAVLIGNVSAHRKLDVGFDKEYVNYSAAAKKFSPNSALSLNEENFKASVTGWTMLQIFNVPLLTATYAGVLIDNKDPFEINFPSSASVMLAQVTGDLVTAKSNSDGVFFIDKLLCDKKNDYSACKTNYARGIFNAQSGSELDRDFIEKERGKKIDPQTYKLINRD